MHNILKVVLCDSATERTIPCTSIQARSSTAQIVELGQMKQLAGERSELEPSP